MGGGGGGGGGGEFWLGAEKNRKSTCAFCSKHSSLLFRGRTFPDRGHHQKRQDSKEKKGQRVRAVFDMTKFLLPDFFY